MKTGEADNSSPHVFVPNKPVIETCSKVKRRSRHDVLGIEALNREPRRSPLPMTRWVPTRAVPPNGCPSSVDLAIACDIS